ncbi:(d)CMP kinase [Homoserinibacter sp. YIM 151385]|uniref:(d)CMP kinase n=1 Tax=Homoserinibacter sp. YIM 151385 TaxID=2985506 RepID=UPI0022EFDE79|nr:(d)CMP kinase [Homoserinibacter sp. YIM 151385]WBU38843.1 (d)CMP kinase [Homoserinibacter sp. YIM 151385]
MSSTDASTADAPRPVVVAIDGPAGSGKSSVSRAAARALGYDFLDTGAGYRALAWRSLDLGIELEDADAVRAVLGGFRYDVEPGADGARVHVEGREVTEEIREPRVSGVVSLVARVPEVREALNVQFRRLIRETPRPGIVVEGRDITTVVAPDAQVRILLTADEEVRIARRAKELSPEQAATARQLSERDRQDAGVVDFLTAAEGVTTVDSTELDFDETVQAVVELVRRAAQKD